MRLLQGTGFRLEVPQPWLDRQDPICLPLESPDLNPIEGLWPLIKAQ